MQLHSVVRKIALLARLRSCIERAFGVLKLRFRWLHKSGGALGMRTPVRCCRIITCCFILHNFAIAHNLQAPDGIEEEDDSFEGDPYEGPQTDGVSVRNHLLNTEFR